MSASKSQSKRFDAAALLASAVEWVLLLGLWMMFVSLLHWNEVLAGAAAALIGAVGDVIVKATDFASFQPRLKQALLIFTEPWYVITGTWSIFVALARRIAGKESEAQLTVVPFDGGGGDRESAARRALMIAYMTIPPNFIIVGIDRERNYLLVHQVSPTPTPWIAKKLGALK